MLRRLVIAVLITFGRTHLFTQLCLINFFSIALLTLMSRPRTFTSSSNRRLKLFNEFSVLLTLTILCCQTNYIIDDLAGKICGWLLIAELCLNILVNMAYLAYGSLVTVI